jgi:hypothetical protein
MEFTLASEWNDGLRLVEHMQPTPRREWWNIADPPSEESNIGNRKRTFSLIAQTMVTTSYYLSGPPDAVPAG